MKKKLCAALAAMVLFLFFGCSSGGTDGSGEIPQNPGINQGGEQKPDQGGESGGGEGENPGDGESEESENNTPSDKIANVEDVIKLVIGEDGYEKLYNSGKFVPTSITLTAQTIEDIGANFSGLSNYKGKEKEKGTINETDQDFISTYKDVLVAQNKGLINITTSKLDSYTIPVKFDGTFNLSEISLPTNNGNGDFTTATLTNGGEGIGIDKLNTIRGNSLPTLKFEKVIDLENGYLPIDDIDKHSYNLYKDYSAVLTKLNISGNFAGTEINGKKISGDTNYTLLSDANTVKPASDTSVKSLTIDALIQMYKQLGISYFVNMIISGTPTATTTVEVDWQLTNIVFEGDMSKIKNTGTKSLKGIVYFKKKAYNNTGNPNVFGLLKLDSLEGVSNDTFGINLSSYSAVLDVRGVDVSAINSYDRGGILAYGGYAHAIYFSNDFNSIKGDKTEINKLTNKFSNMQVTGMGFINVYLGSDRVNGESYGDDTNQSIIGAKNPRSLKEFEYFGNNSSYKFEKSAKETYGSDFNSLSTFDQGKLNSNPYTIALNNKSCGRAKRFV